MIRVVMKYGITTYDVGLSPYCFSIYQSLKNDIHCVIIDYHGNRIELSSRLFLAVETYRDFYRCLYEQIMSQNTLPVKVNKPVAIHVLENTMVLYRNGKQHTYTITDRNYHRVWMVYNAVDWDVMYASAYGVHLYKMSPVDILQSIVDDYTTNGLLPHRVLLEIVEYLFQEYHWQSLLDFDTSCIVTKMWYDLCNSDNIPDVIRYLAPDAVAAVLHTEKAKIERLQTVIQSYPEVLIYARKK